jgi:Xaa-Pro aminopeptidase
MSFDYAARRARIAPALGLTDEILLIGAGRPQPKPEISDAMLPFIAHQEYIYLTGLTEAFGGILAYDPKGGGPSEGGWVSFVPEVTEDDRVWEGREQLPGELLGRFPTWLAARSGRRLVMLGAPLSGVVTDAARTAAVRDAYKHARRPKEPAEIELMRRGAAATAAGYAAIQPLLKPGVSERRLQIELEAEYFRHGAQTTGYDSIIGSGPNAAVFHGAPSARVAQEGEFILIDSGAQIERYVTDVTRTYVAGPPSAFQRDLYQNVLNAELRAIARCRPGAEWKDIHFGAAEDLIGGLVSMGVMNGNAQDLIAQDAHMLFYPHGIGHMLGLGVRDASGLEPGRAKDPRPCLASLRQDLILRENYLVTIEPGLYFIPALLNDQARREKYRDCVNWALAEKHLGIGGVRIEDNIVVTTGAPENLTAAIPKGM